jgi:redox-sensing transcriptional repressor
MGIIGMGNLGTALLQHQNFPARGFNFVAVFDSDPVKIGHTTSYGLIIHDIKELKKIVKEKEVDIGVIATPSSGAQEVADRMIDAGVTAILNFSPAQLNVPTNCIVEHIDFTIKLDILTYKLRHEMGIGIMEY